MTRMQKWESYRNEIDQSSKIGYAIDQQSQQIAKYKKAIDKINPAILQNVDTPKIVLHKGVSEVVVSENKIPSQITKMFKNLNKAKTAANKNNVSTILANLQNENILDNNKKIKEKWLNSNVDYAAITAYIKDMNLSSDHDKALQKDLETKFSNLSNQKTQTQIGTINPLSQNNQKNVGHHVFVISIAIAFVFFLLTLILTLVQIFGKGA